MKKRPTSRIRLTEEEEQTRQELIRESEAQKKTHPPKTCFVICQGAQYINPLTGKTVVEFAPNHEKIRRVAKQDVHQVKRCVACQALHNRYVKIYGGSALRKKLENLAETGLRSLETLKEHGDAISAHDKAEMKRFIKEGQQAEKLLERLYKQ